jgi:hypothetical protein
VSAPAFTPGPWTVESRVAFGKNDYAVSPASGNDGFVAALTHGPDAKANARLIAAAPELYEALVALTRAVNTNELAAAMACHEIVAFANVKDALKLALPAIKKARGEQ